MNTINNSVEIVVLPVVTQTVPMGEPIISRTGNQLGERIEFGRRTFAQIKQDLALVDPSASSRVVSKRAKEIMANDGDFLVLQAIAAIYMEKQRGVYPVQLDSKENGKSSLKFAKFEAAPHKKAAKTAELESRNLSLEEENRLLRARLGKLDKPSLAEGDV